MGREKGSVFFIWIISCFEKGENMWFLCLGMKFVIYLEWRDAAKVEMGREKGSVFFIWIISCCVIVGEFLVLKFFPKLLCM
jgi:hypothetical protein